MFVEHLHDEDLDERTTPYHGAEESKRYSNGVFVSVIPERKLIEEPQTVTKSC